MFLNVFFGHVEFLRLKPNKHIFFKMAADDDYEMDDNEDFGGDDDFGDDDDFADDDGFGDDGDFADDGDDDWGDAVEDDGFNIEYNKKN